MNVNSESTKCEDTIKNVPGVLILSYGEVTTCDIAKNILRAFDQETSEGCITSLNTTFYTCKVKTKYFSTTIHLIPWNDIANIPSEILQLVEAVIVYFEPTGKTFLHHLQDIKKFVNDNNIELGLLVTSKFVNSPSEISYEELKTASNFCLDVITLDDEETKSQSGKTSDNYCQVVEALKNNIWKNLKFASSKEEKKNLDQSESCMEKQLESFENLLSSVRNLKMTQPHMTRDQFMDQAQQLAMMLSKVMDESDDSD